MNPLSTPTRKILDLFFSTIGFRDSLIDDDSAILPHVEKVLQETPYAGLKIGGKAPGRYFEHAVRFLGDDHVVKFVEPAPADVIKNWLDRLQEQKTILERYFPHNLPAFSYFYVPFRRAAAGETSEVSAVLRRSATPRRADLTSEVKEAASLATYALVMEKIEGRPLYEVPDEELFSNQALVKNLVEFLEGNQKMREEYGVFADLIGGPAQKILNPRYTGNLYITKENEVKLVDTVLIPGNFDPKSTPSKYRLAHLYHFCYRTLVLPREKRLLEKLRAFLYN